MCRARKSLCRGGDTDSILCVFACDGQPGEMYGSTGELQGEEEEEAGIVKGVEAAM
jgi:hypothetical protein